MNPSRENIWQTRPGPRIHIPDLNIPYLVDEVVDNSLTDDDVMISSQTAFEEARNNAAARQNRRRTTENLVLDGSRPTKRRRGPKEIVINDNLTFVDLEDLDSDDEVPPSPPKKAVFSCPICTCQLNEEVSTKCGHIFCRACLEAALKLQMRCPICRKRTTSKDVIRVYLPEAKLF